MKKIVFITHGSKNIGMGHVMRSVSIANAFRKKGWMVTFFSKYELGREYIKSQNFDVYGEAVEMESRGRGFDYGELQELQQEWTMLEKLFITQAMDVIFVDSYNVSNEYFSKLKKYTKCLVYLDDLAAFSYEVDVVLNYNVSAWDMGYESLLSGKKLLLGAKYCPLREEFLNVPERNVKAEVSDVLITTGAADPENMTIKLIALCKKALPDCCVHVVVGKAFVWKEALYEQSKGQDGILLHENPERMSKIMLQCDVAVTAGGSTMYELAACGVPMIAFIYAENQRPAVEYLEKNGYLVNLGDYKQVEEMFTARTSELFRDVKYREQMSIRAKGFVDGKGAERVVEEIEKDCSATFLVTE